MTYILMCQYPDFKADPDQLIDRVVRGKFDTVTGTTLLWKEKNEIRYGWTREELDNMVAGIKSFVPDCKFFPWLSSFYVSPDLTTEAKRQQCIEEVLKFYGDNSLFDGLLDDTENWIGTATNHYHYFSYCAAAMENLGPYYPWLRYTHLDYVKSEYAAVGLYDSHPYKKEQWLDALNLIAEKSMSGEYPRPQNWCILMAGDTPTLTQQIQYLQEQGGPEAYPTLKFGVYWYKSMTSKDWEAWYNFVGGSIPEEPPEPPSKTIAARMLPFPLVLNKLWRIRNRFVSEELHRKVHPII